MKRAAVVIATLLLTAAASPSPPSLQNLIREHVRYVFVIYQENRSFDHYFGTRRAVARLHAV
jgi:phospholipase C